MSKNSLLELIDQSLFSDYGSLWADDCASLVSESGGGSPTSMKERQLVILGLIESFIPGYLSQGFSRREINYELKQLLDCWV